MKIIILYIVALLAIGGAAFFSYNHSVKFKDQQRIRLETIAENTVVATEADATEKLLSDEKKALKTALDEQAVVTESIRGLVSTQGQYEKNLAELTATLTEQKKDLADLQSTIQSAKEGLKAAGLGDDINLENIGEKIKELEDTKKNLERELEDKKVLVAGAENRLSGNKAEANRLTTKEMERNVRMGHNAIESVITAVNPDWGFVVIGAGSKSGFTPQTTLLVKRDGRLIGKIRPTAIEPTQTIADVIQESMAPGVRLQPGDRVILAKPETR